MPTNVATEPQMVTPKQQLSNADIVRSYLEDRKDPAKFFAPLARIWSDSRPSDNPVVFRDDEIYFGPEGLKEMAKKFGDHGFTYELEIHSIYACGPVVVVARTDIRKQAGHPDKPVPAVGVFAVKDGKIVEWSDYYR